MASPWFSSSKPGEGRPPAGFRGMGSGRRSIAPPGRRHCPHGGLAEDGGIGEVEARTLRLCPSLPPVIVTALRSEEERGQIRLEIEVRKEGRAGITRIKFNMQNQNAGRELEEEVKETERERERD